MKRSKYLSPIATPLFVFKEFLHRLPHPGFNWHFAPERPEVDCAKVLQGLKTDGFYQLPGYFQGRQLDTLKDAFARLMRDRSEGSCGNPDSEVCTNLMDFDSAFAEAALDNTLLHVISRYYRKHFGIGRADALRIYPTKAVRGGSFMWHHDGRGRQLKAQILLTDLDATGQCMTYVKGSHRTYYGHWRGKGDGTRFEAEVSSDARLNSRIVRITGVAGTVTLFDTNGLHSGTRNDSATRDVLTVYYPTARNFRVNRFRGNEVQKLPKEKQSVIFQNPSNMLV